jgi:hypothetical protein
LIQVKPNLSCHTLSNYHQIFVDRDPRGVYLVVRDYNAYPIRLQAKLSVNNNKEQAQDMPVGMSARNYRTMIARLQAYRPFNKAIYGGIDIKVTYEK